MPTTSAADRSPLEVARAIYREAVAPQCPPEIPRLLVHAHSSGLPGRMGVEPVWVDAVLFVPGISGFVPQEASLVINWPSAASRGDPHAAMVLEALKATREQLLDNPFSRPPEASELERGLAPSDAAHALAAVLQGVGFGDVPRPIVFGYSTRSFLSPLLRDFCTRQGATLPSDALDRLEDAVDLGAVVRAAMGVLEGIPVPAPYPHLGGAATWCQWVHEEVALPRGTRSWALAKAPASLGYDAPAAGGLAALRKLAEVLWS